MIFWYDSLYMDDTVRKNEKKCRKIIEKRIASQKMWENAAPWKKNYYVITLANNRDNLFEIMNTNQMFFRYYGYRNLYILGVSGDYDSALEILTLIMLRGYEADDGFDPRKVFTKDRFLPAESGR